MTIDPERVALARQINDVMAEWYKAHPGSPVLAITVGATAIDIEELAR